MSLSIGIVGLPNVGKSTLFNALTNNQVLAANYPFATIDPNVGVVPVPDVRLQKLTDMFEPEKTTPATVNFVDIAGLVAGAHQGEGLGNKFLAHIREVDAIAQVVRAFKDDNITHVHKEIHPKRDIETINTELILADLSTLQKRISIAEKPAKSDPSLKKDLIFLKDLETSLNDGQPASSHLEKISLNEEQVRLLKGLNLLTSKPFIYIFNLDEAGLKNESLHQELAKTVTPAKAVFICAELEVQLQGLTIEEKQELLSEYGQTKGGLELVIRAGYEALNLITYFTAGKKEVRAWTVREGATAPEAAGVIHTDFQRGFIAAEIVAYKDLVSTGSMNAARAQGKVRTEGKDYVVADGDVIEFKFNV
ncbi:MAG: redox-regulated ATPase YchF [Candidatus Saccharimonadales bacterium]